MVSMGGNGFGHPAAWQPVFRPPPARTLTLNFAMNSVTRASFPDFIHQFLEGFGAPPPCAPVQHRVPAPYHLRLDHNCKIGAVGDTPSTRFDLFPVPWASRQKSHRNHNLGTPWILCVVDEVYTMLHKGWCVTAWYTRCHICRVP